MVANDASALRAYTLVKRTASLGARAASLVVTCHRGQVMPRPGGDDETSGGFDRIICDVPCTGDGTTRKHPEVFGRWEVALAMRQHPLQLQIAMRGVALLNVGGVMCYSTCSLNPIEDESVVAEVLRRCGGAIELLDGADEVATELAGGCGPGMEQWPMLDFRLRRQPSLEALKSSAEVPEGEKRMYMRSMWPPSAQRRNGSISAGAYGCCPTDPTVEASSSPCSKRCGLSPHTQSRAGQGGGRTRTAPPSEPLKPTAAVMRRALVRRKQRRTASAPIATPPSRCRCSRGLLRCSAQVEATPRNREGQGEQRQPRRRRERPARFVTNVAG